jgi:hypothetical protein
LIKLKNQIFNVLKLVLIVHILISSGAALYGQITGSQFDPIKAILKFQIPSTRDESPTKDVEYTAWQKFKSTIYGAITGKICDSYSAYGAISSDYTIVGDFRDIVIQAWKYLNNDEVDEIVFTLSASGVILSVVPNPFNTIYLKGFYYKNPIVILGLTKSHFVIHTLKILKKYNLVGMMVPILGLYLVLSLFPSYLTAAIFISSVVYLVISLIQIFKIKGET